MLCGILNVPLWIFALAVLIGLTPYNFLSVHAGTMLQQLASSAPDKGLTIIDRETTVKLVSDHAIVSVLLLHVFVHCLPKYSSHLCLSIVPVLLLCYRHCSPPACYCCPLSALVRIDCTATPHSPNRKQVRRFRHSADMQPSGSFLYIDVGSHPAQAVLVFFAFHCS